MKMVQCSINKYKIKSIIKIVNLTIKITDQSKKTSKFPQQNTWNSKTSNSHVGAPI